MLTGLHEFNGQKMFFATNGSLQSNGKPSSWKKRQEIGIITMRMESPHLVKRISMEAYTTLTKKV